MINNRYQILQEIGSGGIGKVFKATDLFKRITVAIKVLLRQEPDHVERFKNEFLLLGKLNHPNIVKVYDFGFSDTGEPYFTMEYIEGSDWTAFFQPLDYSKFWHLIFQICTTLDFLHSKRIIHGDIKPSNILITKSPEGQLTPKFTDFGFAKYEKAEGSSWWKGTLTYLAPEIIRGEKYTSQADLYSVGILIYETLFGRPPFDEEDQMNLAKSHLERDVVIPKEPPIPAGLKNLILRLVEKNPLDRFFSAKDVLDEVRKISGLAPEGPETLLKKSLIKSADFVGREKELNVLRETLTHLTQDRNEFVLVVGESGVGKTMLVEKFSAWAQLEGFSTFKVSLRENGIFEVFKNKFLQFLDGTSYPSMMILQHLELADDSLFKFLPDLIFHTRNKQVLICFTLTKDLTFPEESQKVIGMEKRIRAICGDSLISIRLNRLTQTEVRNMACSMFGLREGVEKIAAAIHQETQGNPSLIGQLMESLSEEGKIRRENGKWAIEPDSIEKSRIPPSVRDEMERRLAGLKPESVELLVSSSVWDSEIDLDLLVQLTEFDSSVTLACLDDLLSHGLMEESSVSDKKKFRFVNNLFRRLVYDRVDPEKRKGLHQKAGEILERKTTQQREGHIYRLASHFYQAGDVKRAMNYSLLAVKKAESENDHDQAIANYAYALELYDKVTAHSLPSKEDILESLADQFELVGELNKSLELYQEALKIWDSISSASEKPALIHRKIGKIYEKMGMHGKAIEFLEKSLERFKAIESMKDKAEALVSLGWVHLRRSDYEKARSRFEEALIILHEETASKELGFALSGLGSVYWALGDYSQASRYHHESLRIFIKVRETKKIADCYGNLGLVARSKGELKKAVGYFRKCLGLQETIQDQYRLSILYNNLATAYFDLSHWDQALEYFSKALQLQEKISDLLGLGFSYNNIGLIYLRKGELCQALDYFNSAIVQFQATRQKSGLALVYYNIGDLHANREEFDLALGYLEKSLGIRKELGEEAGMADCFALLGKTFLLQSVFDQANWNLLQAQSFYQKQENKEGQAEVLLSLAELCIKTKAWTQAETHFTKAQEILQQSDSRFLQAYFLRARAHFVNATGDPHGCQNCLSESAKNFRELEAKVELGQTYLEIGKIKIKLKRYIEAKAFLREALAVFRKAKIESKKKEVETLLERINDLPLLEDNRTATFYRLAELLNDIWDTDELLSKSLELIIELLNAERGAIIYYSDKDKSFEVRVSQGIEQETSQDAIAISRQVLKDVLKSDSPLIVQDARKDPRLAESRSVIMYNILSILCVPLKTKSKLIGTVYLDHRSLPAIFSSEDVDFLKAFANLIATAIEKNELYVKANEEFFQLREVLHRTYEYPDIIGKSEKMQEVFNMVEKVANSKTGVLILGENGTGKELIANLIHARSQRKEASFIKVNCAALPETLLESELFGIEEKTATGVGFRAGKFELADGGTIFLDEIGDMNLSVQAKVLRVIEHKEFERVGGRRSIKIDVRVVSATNMDLEKKIEEGSFRKDLYFRLNPIVITIPPLRERKEDIPFLLDYFLRRISEENNKPPIRLSKRIMDALKEYSWPGNVRELEHLIESAILLSEDGSFPEKLLPKEVRRTKGMINLDRYGKLQEVLDWVEKKKLLQALDKNVWNQSKAAEELGISESKLRRRMKRHAIKRTHRIRSS